MSHRLFAGVVAALMMLGGTAQAGHLVVKSHHGTAIAAVASKKPVHKVSGKKAKHSKKQKTRSGVSGA